MPLVTGYPILYALWLSLFRYDLRLPDQRAFVGLANCASVLTSEVCWQSLLNTLVITVGSVSIELALGMLLALVMHRALFQRRSVRASVLGLLAQTVKNMPYDFVGLSASPARTVVIIENS